MTDTSWLGTPINVRPVPAEQQVAFIDLLRRLDADEWAKPTICPGWSVKDVAVHVLGDHIGRLSIYRDGFHVLHPQDGEAFPTFLDRINDGLSAGQAARWTTLVEECRPVLGNEGMEAVQALLAERGMSTIAAIAIANRCSVGQ
ncbi:maleylpyruvate isomerase N-terminal domain-containing protein [Actinomadura citrea]|uniref:Uncharacterized protein (TIGR03083 family) n=1 Tax=Actinomadura citrea TaxID=46158 RepID=A0A7Y9GE92_9ACTN|nr:maleylpyruvate isomerase N-terminal domain-containing protein [Actinomadura citrea]NYE14938.1 uncharacterized protein (TIGR03083 family) [Actinomadura citrea]GGU11265.1 hypothetical protein GCM10010177_82470 [Actinomadura citrea]